MQIEQLEKMKSPKQAAKALGVKENRVYQYIEEARLKAIKVGGRWFIEPESIQEVASQPRQAGNPNFRKVS